MRELCAKQRFGMFTFQEHFFSLSLAIYLAVSVVVAAVRWGHKCEPYARYADYYYPGWKSIIFCYLSNLILFPAVLFPGNSDYVLLVRMMLILGSPALCALMLFSYFGTVLNVYWWRRPVYALVITFLIVVLVALVIAIIPGLHLYGFFGRCYFALAGTLALFYFLSFFMALRMVVRALKNQARENFSNPKDFPVKFAQVSLFLPILHLAISWTSTFIGSLTALSIGLMLLSVQSVFFLLGILSPHRSLSVEQLEAQRAPLPEPAPEPPTAQPEVTILSAARKKELLKAIRKCVEGEKAYLDSHLTLASLAQKIGVNRTYVSLVMSDSLGGFFVYVNRCRLAHAAQLKVEQPDMPMGEVIAASGFGSRQSYYNVRRQLSK